MANTRFMPTAAPDLKAVLDRVAYDTARSINCALAGKVVSFDAAKNTASVQIQMKTMLANGTEESFPILSDCPVFVLAGGNSHVSMPIKKDDYCLVIFHDRDIDAWWASGQPKPPASNRAHSISDGIVLVGITPKSEPIDLGANPGIYSTDETVSLVGEGAEIDAGGGKVSIRNQLHDMKTLIDELFTAISQMTMTYSAGPTAGATTQPNNLSTFAELKLKFDALLDT